MTEEKAEWMVSGECVEGCTSPAVCPAYFGSPFPKDLHEGKSQCEGVWSFNITKGYHKDIDLGGSKVCYTFNSPSGFPDTPDPWRCIIYIDDRASDAQAKALEAIYRECWNHMGEVIDVKRGEISFTKEKAEGSEAANYEVEIKGVYHFKTVPMLSMIGNQPRHIISTLGGIIYIGKSEINEFKDTDLPRNWNKPGMSCTYHDFVLSPQMTHWQP